MLKRFGFTVISFSKGNTAKELFKRFDEQIQKFGLVMHERTLIDATWTKKRGDTYFGYKKHIKVGSDSKVIMDYSLTDAAVHDSKRFLVFINKGEDKNVYADSAYKSKELEQKVKEMGEAVLRSR